ncbi:MAG: hypothetical protein JSV77_05890 [Dehalococcoidales bacterium]|nr:MAG: hypothetical protein JSV77_05890 [Dehalococcoidales bacterium]
MANCPNCGLSTVRTKDWACQWCGYPLVSGIYGKTSKTFAELKHEREGEAITTALLIESEPATEPEPETNQVAEIEASTEPEPEPAQETTDDTAVSEPALEEEPEPEPVMEQEPTSEEEPEPKADKEPEPVQEVTVAELCSSYQSYGMAGHDEFKDSVFRVRGMVDSVVNKDVVGQYRVALTDNEPHPLGEVYCKFGKDDAAELNRLTVGQELTVEGRYEGFVTNIVLTDCALVG